MRIFNNLDKKRYPIELFRLFSTLRKSFYARLKMRDFVQFLFAAEPDERHDNQIWISYFTCHRQLDLISINLSSEKYSQFGTYTSPPDVIMKVFVELTGSGSSGPSNNTFSIEFSNYFSFPMAGGLNFLPVLCICFSSPSTLSPLSSEQWANTMGQGKLSVGVHPFGARI